MATKKIRSANAAKMSTLAPELPRSDTLRDGRSYTVSLVHADALSSRERDTIYAIFDENMSYLQQLSSFPYTESSKREELFHPDTRYLLVHAQALGSGSARAPIPSSADSSDPSTSSSSTITSTITEDVINPLLSLATGTAKFSSSASGSTSANGPAFDADKKRPLAETETGQAPVARQTTPDDTQRSRPGGGVGREDSPILGFCSFRFDTEETLSSRDAEVIYCYELQLSPSLRGRGLGKTLISHLEEIGRRRGLDKCMLTCLKRNTDALSFYTKRGYQPDEIDPTRMAEEEEWADEDENDSDGDGNEQGEGDDRSEDRREVDYVILSKDLREKRRSR